MLPSAIPSATRRLEAGTRRDPTTCARRAAPNGIGSSGDPRWASAWETWTDVGTAGGAGGAGELGAVSAHDVTMATAGREMSRGRFMVNGLGLVLRGP